MKSNVIDLACELVAIPSETLLSNVAIIDYLENWLTTRGFAVERVGYTDPVGEEKFNLIAKRGDGTGGIGFFSHSDTVPGDPQDWHPFDPIIRDGKLIGRGSCDMKGPLAATLIAASRADTDTLKKPIYIVISADEERGHRGAHHILEHSAMLRESWPEHAVVAEPTQLHPVYAHKGAALITVTALGRAAHTSTEKGISANLIMAPFLADMAALAPIFRSEERFQNPEFDPATNGFNLTINDGNCRTNVTAAKTVVKISLRLMPDDHREEQIAMIEEKARARKLSMTYRIIKPFYIAPDARVVQAACRVTGISRAITVPYGTEAEAYQKFTQPVVLGPGSIDQAHTIGEWVSLKQLEDAVGIYSNLIETFCR
jgi:acetylornithine deacetylase